MAVALRMMEITSAFNALSQMAGLHRCQNLHQAPWGKGTVTIYYRSIIYVYHIRRGAADDTAYAALRDRKSVV